MPPEKSTTYECRRGLPQQGMRRVISLTINDLNRLSSSDLPYRQLRKYPGVAPVQTRGDLPYRQLRNDAFIFAASGIRDLPYRQLRNSSPKPDRFLVGDLPYRQLRND